jgi:hypothetical protein
MDEAVVIDGMLQLRVGSEPVPGERVHIYMNDEYLGMYSVTDGGEVHLASPLQCNSGDKMRIARVLSEVPCDSGSRPTGEDREAG